jgi:acetylglutamate kinase
LIWKKYSNEYGACQETAAIVLGDDFGADAFIREYLEEQTVRDPAIHNMRLPDTTLNKLEILELINEGIIGGGMLPKVQACMRAIESGVRKTHIVDGRVPHSLLLEIFTNEGIGTEIIA